MRVPRSTDEALASTIHALSPILPSSVVIGAWALRALRSHPSAPRLDWPAPATTDLDVMLSSSDESSAAAVAACLAQLGFQEELTDFGRVPTARWVIETQEGSASVEFLVPAKQAAGGTGRAVGALTAQQLANSSMLLESAWTVQVGEGSWTIPNPASLVAQRLFARRRRQSPAKAAKDLLAIVEVLVLAGPMMAELNALWRGRIAPGLSRSERRRVHQESQRLAIASEAHERAARLARTSGWLSPSTGAALADACRDGFAALFG